MTNCVLMLTDVQVLPRVVQFRNDLYYSCSIKSLELRRAEATNTTVVVFFFLLSLPLIPLDDSFVKCGVFPPSGLVGLQHSGLLVHRAAGAKPAVPDVDL